MAEPDKSLGKKILGFFIKEEERKAIPPAHGPVPSAGQSTVAPRESIPNSTGTAELDRKFVEHFVTLLEKANLPGPDYFEFKQALKSMEGLDLDESKKYQASWASFKAMGGVTDPSILITSAQQYAALLDQDRAGFLKDVEKTIHNRVGGLQQEITRLQEENKTLAQQIEELQKKINTNTDRMSQITGEIQEQSTRITNNRDKYDITYHSFVEQINSDISKINQFLK